MDCDDNVDYDDNKIMWCYKDSFSRGAVLHQIEVSVEIKGKTWREVHAP